MWRFAGFHPWLSSLWGESRRSPAGLRRAVVWLGLTVRSGRAPGKIPNGGEGGLLFKALYRSRERTNEGDRHRTEQPRLTATLCQLFRCWGLAAASPCFE